jgi:hypothetical protein
VPPGPGRLAAGVGAVAMATDPGERGPADRGRATGRDALPAVMSSRCRRAVGSVQGRGFRHGWRPPLAGCGCGRGGHVAR